MSWTMVWDGSQTLPGFIPGPYYGVLDADVVDGSRSTGERAVGVTISVQATGTPDCVWSVSFGGQSTIYGTTSGAAGSFTESDLTGWTRYLLAGVPGFTPTCDSGTVTFTYITMTVTTVPLDDPPPIPPPADPPDGGTPNPPGGGPNQPPATPPIIIVRFTENLPNLLQYDTDYTVKVEAVNSLGGRMTNAHGTISLAFNNGTAIKTVGFLVNGTAALTTPLTFVEGQVTCTLRFPSGTDAFASDTMLYMYITNVAFIIATANTQVQYGPVSTPGSKLAAPGLAFTVQPPTAIDVGATFFVPVQVSAVNAAGTVNASWAGDIVLTMKALDGTDATTYLGGGKSIAPTAGVSPFPGLFISKIGFYSLVATSTVGATILTGISTGITVVGDDGEAALRQNLRDDATLWVKTTNISSPTYGTFTDGNKTTLDGDEAVTANVTFDGTRWCFPYVLKTVLVRFKVSVSTLASAPIISLYTSQDTTTGQNGTWTLQSSMTPATTGVFIAEFAFSSVLYAKGLWLTLNDNGGAATANWYSQQVMGKYLGASITFLTDDSANLPDQHYVAIPLPIETLAGARTVQRNVRIRNNTASPLALIATPSAARSTGDVLMDSDNFTIVDQNNTSLAEGFTLIAHGAVLATLRYVIAANDNDKSGLHYGRLSIETIPLPQTYTSYFTQDNIDSSGNPTSDINMRSLSTGVPTVTTSTGASTTAGQWFDSVHGRAWHSMAHTGNDHMQINRHTVTSSSLTLLFNTIQIESWSAAEKNALSGIGILDDTILLANTLNTTIVSPAIAAWTEVVGAVYVARSACTTFTLPAQTSGEKRFYPSPDSTIAVQNGTAVGSVVYRITSAGAVVATLDPTTTFGGRGLRTVAWDSTNNEYYLVSALSGGTRLIARFTKAGVHIATVSVATEPSVEADGIGVASPYVYIMYGGKYMYRHDVQTLANPTLLHTLGATLTVTPGGIILSY